MSDLQSAIEQAFEQRADITPASASAEVREAVDFCRYYAHEAESKFNQPTRLPGPAGETNHISLHGRGVFVCISPWNFPLAIFVGQIVAALATGNTVVAKPAPQTPAIALRAAELMTKAGVPAGVCNIVLGAGDTGQARQDAPNES